MPTILADLGVSLPVIAAPMAGGPSTPEFVVAAAHAGSLGQLAGGYKTPQALADQIAAVRAASVPFGVNLFVPNPVPVEPAALRRYADALQVEADVYGLRLDADPIEDDDFWPDKIDLLLAANIPLVSFTFGLPSAAVLARFRTAGTVVVQTVTSLDEARAAAEAGVDALAVQATAAGGHSGTWTPDRLVPPIPIADLVGRIRASVAPPVIAAGGLATAADIAQALAAGASVAMVGTVLLRTDESGASATHRDALAAGTTTVVTRAFTGRPARALRNTFIDRYDQLAPSGYPAVHHLTSALRKAAAAAGDPQRLHLWAGTGFRHATVEPLDTALTRIAP